MGIIYMVLLDRHLLPPYETSDMMDSGFLIAGLLPMGIATEKAGSAQPLVDQVIALMGSLGT